MTCVLRECCSAEVFDGSSAADLAAALKGRRVLGAHRKGKQMWLTLEGDKPNLLMHFGEHHQHSLMFAADTRHYYE